MPLGLAPDGTLVFVTLDPSGSTIGKVDPARPQNVAVLVDRPQDAPDGALSRDARFLAYQTMTSAGWQIRILDLTSGRHTTVTDGFNPAWSPDASTLLYQSGASGGVSGVMKLPFSSPVSGVAGKSEVVFDEYAFIPGCCDIATDHRALALVPMRDLRAITVVLNWPDLMRPSR